MAFYHNLKDYQRKEAAARAAGQDIDYPGKADWIASRLLELRTHLRDQIIGRRRSNSLIIGSWNIRAFDGGRPRMDESYHYIAEIIGTFDICAVQEVKTDLAPLERLVRLLGPNWEYFVNDVTEGDDGNSERMAFLYNRDRVFFRNLIGELVLPREGLLAGRPLARSPFFASFQAGWFRFTLCSAHIVFGDDYALRVAEIDAISGRLAERSKKEEQAGKDQVYVLIGDMNIEEAGDEAMQAMTQHGLHVPLFGPTNMGGDKHYDQMAFSKQDVKTKLLNKGSFDWRGAVFRAEDAAHYRPHAEKMRGGAYADWERSYKSWTTHEMSDHLPIWIELEVDYSDDYLRRFTG